MKNITSLGFAGAALAASLFFSGAASAATYVAATDFNGVQGGAAGVFTYNKIVGSTVTPLNAAADMQSFGGGDAFNTPLIADLGSSLLMHPGQFGEVVDLRFTALTAGTYKATFNAYLSDPSCGDCGGTDGVTFALNNVDSALLTHASYAAQTLTHTFTLGAGGTIDFTVDANSNYNWDSTTVSAIVASVPEPATWISMILGFGLLGFVLRARKSATAVVA